MKRTDMERVQRELDRTVKRDKIQTRRDSQADSKSVGSYTKMLASAFMHDDQSIYNIQDDEVLELLMEMKEELPDKAFNTAVRKAIKMTKVPGVDAALEEIVALVS